MRQGIFEKGWKLEEIHFLHRDFWGGVCGHCLGFGMCSKTSLLKGWTFLTFFLGRVFIAQIRQRTRRWALRVSNCCGCMMYDWLADLLHLARLRDFNGFVTIIKSWAFDWMQKKRLKLKRAELIWSLGVNHFEPNTWPWWRVAWPTPPWK